jgi:sugar lactone lactonase YvrE
MMRTVPRAALLTLACLLVSLPAGSIVHSSAPEVVATGVVRPLQIAIDGATLVVLGPGTRGDAAAEIHRVALDAQRPVDLSRERPVTVPFPGPGSRTLGSLAIERRTRALYLGEENGGQVWRMNASGTVDLFATGLRRLAGGGTVIFDNAGRLILLDHADPLVSPREERLPSGLDQLLRDDPYRGALIFRLAVDTSLPLPRRVTHVPPFYPRESAARAGGLSFDFLSLATLPGGELIALASTGALYRVSDEAPPALVARLPRAQYARTNMAVAPDGSVYVSGGFHVGQVFRVAADGNVTVVAADLADPAGIAVGPDGAVYVAESSRHRILRVR